MMASIKMDDTKSETEPISDGASQALEVAPEKVPEAAAPTEFESTPWPVLPRPAPRPIKLSAPMRPRFWTAALAVALLFTAGGLALLYLDDTSFQRTAGQLRNDNQSLKSQNKALQAQLLTTQTNLTATLSELATVRAELEHPNLTIWNVPQDIRDANWYLAGGAPDTFTYHLRATSTGPMTISILTLEDFAKAMACVTNGYGTTNYCMHHSGTPAQTFAGVTTVNYDFHLAEGCADYVVVFTAASHVTVTPNVGVTYNPAPKSTGACA